MQTALTIICSTTVEMLAGVVVLGLLSGSVTFAHPGKSQRPKLTEDQECATEAGGGRVLLPTVWKQPEGIQVLIFLLGKRFFWLTTPFL